VFIPSGAFFVEMDLCGIGPLIQTELPSYRYAIPSEFADIAFLGFNSALRPNPGLSAHILRSLHDALLSRCRKWWFECTSETLVNVSGSGAQPRRLTVKYVHGFE
jgi:hypothetical protein